MEFGAILYILLGIASFGLVAFFAWAAFSRSGKDPSDE